MNLKTHPPFTVIYRGTIKDTATLVGLAQTRANVGLIAFTGDMNLESKKYFEVINRWLELRNLPRISIHPRMTAHELEQVLECPLKEWGWGDNECATAIRLANLPLPPKSAAA